MIFDYKNTEPFLGKDVLHCNFEVIEPKVNQLRVVSVNTDNKTIEIRKIKGKDVKDVAHFETPVCDSPLESLVHLGEDEYPSFSSINPEPVTFIYESKVPIVLRFYRNNRIVAADIKFY